MLENIFKKKKIENWEKKDNIIVWNISFFNILKKIWFTIIDLF